MFGLYCLAKALKLFWLKLIYLGPFYFVQHSNCLFLAFSVHISHNCYIFTFLFPCFHLAWILLRLTLIFIFILSHFFAFNCYFWNVLYFQSRNWSKTYFGWTPSSGTSSSRRPWIAESSSTWPPKNLKIWNRKKTSKARACFRPTARPGLSLSTANSSFEADPLRGRTLRPQPRVFIAKKRFCRSCFVSTWPNVECHRVGKFLGGEGGYTP